MDVSIYCSQSNVLYKNSQLLFASFTIKALFAMTLKSKYVSLSFEFVFKYLSINSGTQSWKLSGTFFSHTVVNNEIQFLPKNDEDSKSYNRHLNKYKRVSLDIK